MTTYTQTRPPAVAGLFYPADPAGLRRELAQLLGAPMEPDRSPKALVVPHAGYVYSGPSAAAAYRTLAVARGQINRVVLLGPAHRVYVRGCALSSARAFTTPLGAIPLTTPSSRLRSLPNVVVNDEAHAQEHALEVQLPFLQTVLSEFELLPIVVGEATAQEVAAVLHEVWGGEETLIVISSDLSHYLNYVDAADRDQATVAKILARAVDLQSEEACGARPLNGFLLEARRRGLTGKVLNLCNSGDTAGSRDRVVGYCAVAFSVDDAQRGDTLLAIARSRIGYELQQGIAPSFDDAWLTEFGATFVTLTSNGRLRGCIGSLEARRGIGVDVAENAAAAAFRDPRFSPLSVAEFPLIKIEVSKLSPATELKFTNEHDALAQLRSRIDGVIFECDTRRATFLPQVWAQLPKPDEFLRHLKQKAGLDPDFWSPAIRLSRYTVQKWREL